MTTIWKYTVESLGSNDSTTLEVPQGAQFLAGEIRNSVLELWAKVDPQAEKVKLPVFVYATGATLREVDQTYLSTVRDGRYVWHVYIGTEVPLEDTVTMDEPAEDEDDMGSDENDEPADMEVAKTPSDFGRVFSY